MHTLTGVEIKYVKGVGEARARLLKSELGISSLRDLLYYFPHKYADRSRFYKIAEFSEDMSYVQLRGSFIGFAVEGEGARKRLRALFSDGERTMEVVWFTKVKELSTAYHIGRVYTLFGKPTLFRSTWSMVHPEVDSWSEEEPPKGVVGIYSIPEKLRQRGFTNRTFRRIIENALTSNHFAKVEDMLPFSVMNECSLMPLKEAIINMHTPQSQLALHRARHRMKFEELYFVELHILRYSRNRTAHTPGLIMQKVGAHFLKFYNEVLPFSLTDAQKRVVREIHHDLRRGLQMNRLVQGDVGSGKTLVAFLSMLLAVDNDAQTCLMAPTEILATQHYEGLLGWCEKLGIGIELLKGSTSKKSRERIRAGLMNGTIKILVGTHALIEDNVQFRNLGLAVIDEQHRFGVAQRARLWSKNSFHPPHVLVMTATPIPRTLAMTVYGDLEVSVIDQLPPGRKPITTLLRYEEQRMQVLSAMTHELDEGRQAYIVYPLIKENEKIDLKSLEEGYAAIKRMIGQKYEIAYVHGQMKADEKKHQMDKFASGQASVLVATTVIEVGVNVPNASVMIINDAHRFGLAQLHQLRGRVGRGADKSYCVLMSKANIGGTTRKRLELMTKTGDGFIIAEEDMKMRGPGDIDGTLQSGLAFDLKVASLASDGDVITLARKHALATLDKYTSLCSIGHTVGTNEEITLSRELHIRFGQQADWSKIS